MILREKTNNEKFLTNNVIYLKIVIDHFFSSNYVRIMIKKKKLQSDLTASL
jgi:hypothetical protein